MLRKLLWTGPRAVRVRTRRRPAIDGDPDRVGHAPSGHQLGPHPSGGKGGGPNPFAVVAAAAAAGALLAKLVDWRAAHALRR